MRAWFIGVAIVGMISAASAAGAVARLEIRGAAAHVVIIPEARADIVVGVIRSNRILPLNVTRSGDVTTIDGGLGRRVRGCPRLDRGLGVRIRGLGNIPAADLPQLAIRTPMDVRVSAGEGVSGELGRAASLEFENRGCGGWIISNVRGRIRLDQIGSGAVRAGRAGAADLSVAGGGQIAIGPIAGSLTAVSSGEGTISVERVSGPVIARVGGSGGIDVVAGQAPQLNASIAGSGSIKFGGVAGSVTASVAGSGVVNVARAKGPVSRHVFGAGQIRVGP